jgi:hypothetical protein
MKTVFAALITLLLPAFAALGEVVTQTVEYQEGDTVLEGFVAQRNRGRSE